MIRRIQVLAKARSTIPIRTGPIYTPRNDKQRKYIELLETERPCIVVAHGTAGSGKTKLAVEVGLQKLLDKQVQRMVITRPAIAVDDENHGFLPGGLWEKYKVWIMPIVDTLHHHIDQVHLDAMVVNRTLEIAPLAFMRGRTFENSWILCDEAQNLTPSQMLMLLTRIGRNSKLVLTGDPLQHDRHTEIKSKALESKGCPQNGLNHFLTLLTDEDNQHPDIRVVQFDECDVERHHIIPHILKMFNKNITT